MWIYYYFKGYPTLFVKEFLAKNFLFSRRSLLHIVAQALFLYVILFTHVANYYFHVEIFWPSVHWHEAFIFKDKGVIADEKEFAQALMGIS